MTEQEQIKSYMDYLRKSGQLDESDGTDASAAADSYDSVDLADDADINDLGNPSDLPDFMDESLNKPEYTGQKPKLMAGNDQNTMTDAEPSANKLSGDETSKLLTKKWGYDEPAVRTDLNSYDHPMTPTSGPLPNYAFRKYGDRGLASDPPDYSKKARGRIGSTYGPHNFNQDVTHATGSRLTEDILGTAPPVGLDNMNDEAYAYPGAAPTKTATPNVVQAPMTPQSGNGAAKATLPRSRLNIQDFQMPEGGYTPSGEYEDPSEPQDDGTNGDKDSNRQRLLAYLGMGAQDAITGMTGFKGTTNVYDQMLLAARQKDKNALTKQGRINDFLRQKNAFKLGEQKLSLADMLNKRKLSFDAWKIKQQLLGKDVQTDKVITGKSQLIGDRQNAGQKSEDHDTGKEYVKWTEAGEGEQVRVALKDLRGMVKDLQTDPDYNPSMLNNYLTALYKLTPGLAEQKYPKIHAMQQKIERVLLPALKPTFGGQFTRDEGAKLDGTAFNPRLPPEDNMNAMKAWISNLQASLDKRTARFNYFATHGRTMAGYNSRPKPGLVEKVSE